ncbi:MAG: response regulator, partial [Nitrososphaeraceae archaeon]
MNGFELCEKLLELDVNVRVCFISAAEVNIEALREVYPSLSFGCFIKKPVTIEYFAKRLLAEL